LIFAVALAIDSELLRQARQQPWTALHRRIGLHGEQRWIQLRVSINERTLCLLAIFDVDERDSEREEMEMRGKLVRN
jgi:hypothetical protein